MRQDIFCMQAPGALRWASTFPHRGRDPCPPSVSKDSFLLKGILDLSLPPSPFLQSSSPLLLRTTVPPPSSPTHTPHSTPSRADLTHRRVSCVRTLQTCHLVSSSVSLAAPQTPAPNEYDTEKGLVWKDRNFSLRLKDVTWPYDTRSW